MSKDFSCRTCENLCMIQNVKNRKATTYYVCDWNDYYIPQSPDEYFCADHTDTETVKRIREGV